MNRPSVAAPAHRDILQLVTSRQLRGAEVFAAQLSDRLAEAGWNVTYAGLYPGQGPPPTISSAATLDLEGRPGPPVSPSLVLRLAGLLRILRPALVQANGSDTLKYSVLASRLVRPRPILVYRSISIPSRWIRGPLHRHWNRLLLAGVDHVAAVSTGCREDLLATYRLPAERVSVLPIGTPLPQAGDGPSRRHRLVDAMELSPGEGHLLLIHIGSFTAEKDHRTLLEAFRSIVARVPAASLALVGDGELRPSVERLALDLGVHRAVRFLGRRPDAAELAGGADLLLLPSRIEGVPGVVLEAAVRGVAAVASDVGSLRDVVVPGVTGELVPPGDPAALSDAAVRLLEDDELRHRLGEQARRRAVEVHALPRVAERFAALYDDLLRTAASAA